MDQPEQETTAPAKPKLTLCRATTNLSGVGKIGTLVWVDLDDLRRHTNWLERGILVVEPDPGAPPAEDAVEVPAAEQASEPEAAAPVGDPALVEE